MTLDNTFRDPELTEPTLFSALLVPHRSLTRKSFIVLMAFVSVASFAAGMVFLVMGAWPVMVFFALDAVAIYWAFRINFRDAKAFEEISMTSSELRIRRVNPRGDTMEWTFNPRWVRLDQTVHEEFGVERLYLVSRGRSVAIARFLGPDEKTSFAKALTSALQIAKQGPIYNPVA